MGLLYQLISYHKELVEPELCTKLLTFQRYNFYFVQNVHTLVVNSKIKANFLILVIRKVVHKLFLNKC